MPITVALADDSPLVRDALRQMLEGRSGIEIVASCEDLDSVLAAAVRLRPDVVLTDMRMPPTETDEGLQVAVRLGQTDPGIGVIVLGQAAEPIYASALLASSPTRRGYLLKERAHDRARLTAAIASVAAGGSVIDEKVVAVLLSARRRAEPPAPSGLVPHDLDVLALVAQGRSDAEIGGELGLTEAGARQEVDTVLRRLGIAGADDVGTRVRGAVRALAESDAQPGR